jgi:hypothetical protein
VYVDACQWGFLSNPVPLLLMDDPQLAAELNSLAGRLEQQLCEELLQELALALQQGQQAAAGAAAREQVAGRLLALACDMGLAALVARLLPVALGPAAAAAAAEPRAQAAADAAATALEYSFEGQEELSLLHRAVRSGSVGAVRALLHWGRHGGHRWAHDAGGPGGLSALHLAALLGDGGAVLLQLLDGCASPGAFTEAASDDGVTPFHLAAQMGHFAVDKLLLLLRPQDGARVQERQVPQQQVLLQQLDQLQQALGQQQQEAPEPRYLEQDSVGLDACLSCRSLIPPLLLAIAASCSRCSTQLPLAAAMDADWQLRQQQEEESRQLQQLGSTREQRAEARAAKRGPRADGGSSSAAANPANCDHAPPVAYRIAAMCQCCHQTRSLRVV